MVLYNQTGSNVSDEKILILLLDGEFANKFTEIEIEAPWIFDHQRNFEKSLRSYSVLVQKG